MKPSKKNTLKENLQALWNDSRKELIAGDKRR